MDKTGVHAAHCCKEHGCKYGDNDCPVVSGEVEQKNPCQDCCRIFNDNPYQKVIDIFNEIDLTSQIFSSGGVTMSSDDGETKFYKKGVLDKAFKRIEFLRDEYELENE